jgi:Tol biopolymer transport system component
MTNLEDDIRTALRAQAQALRVPERPAMDREVVEPSRRPGSRWLIAAACLALIAAGIVALALRAAGDPEPAPPVDSLVPDTTTPAPTIASVVPDTSAPALPIVSVVPDTAVPASATNGWVAVDADGGEIYLVRPGEDARLLVVDESVTADDACPAWSPDGTRLLFGRVTGASDAAPGGAELVIVPIGPDGTADAPNVIALDGFDVLEGFDAHPCGIWAPDGRWVAFAGTGDVWVVDTQTSAIRRIPDLRPSDLEWRAGTDELTIAGDLGTNRGAPRLSAPVTVYSAATGELRQLGSVQAAYVTWSPDGSILAYQGGENDGDELWLVDADGTNQRLLTLVGQANHGIGPVWSPAGDRIAYQRLPGGGERHDVVLVSVADGNETVIEPSEIGGWYPFSVTWSPDGTTLLYTAWSADHDGVIAVPADAPNDTTVLTDVVAPGTDIYSHAWIPTQSWGMAADGGPTTPANGEAGVIGGHIVE